MGIETQAGTAESYLGTARIDGPEPVEVTVNLRGHFEPIDGRFHWYGRISPNDVLAGHYRPGSTVILTTEHGSAAGRISDVDPWGRFRISGLGRPPF